MKFSKWHGLGNDFIIVEPLKCGRFDFRGEAQHLCDRHFGIGADGVVTVKPLGADAFEMRIYNSDGTEPEMCGNATRCVGLYIKRNRLSAASEIELHTRAGIVRPRVLDNGSVCVDMGEPLLLRGEIPVAGEPNAPARDLTLNLPGCRLTGTGVSMGNPHCVIFVEDINQVPLETWGPMVENDLLFPKKTNVEFVEVISPQMVRMRVWERGCGITLACGTGSCAAAVAGFLTGRTGRSTTVLLDGGELQIDYSQENNHIYMTGPACEVFQGDYKERC